MTAYKLLRQRKNGTLAPLFINRKQTIPIGEWLESGFHPTPGYAPRAGWHVMAKPVAPHLSTKGRVWAEVEIKDHQSYTRPASQGGLWYLANHMRVVRLLSK
jgi:hypothetical protein